MISMGRLPAIHGDELGLMVVISGPHAERRKLFLSAGKRPATSFQPSAEVTRPGLARTMVFDPRIWFSSIALVNPSAARALESLCVRVTTYAQIIEQLAHVLGLIRSPAKVWRVELDHLIAHLGDCADGACKIFRELIANGIQFQTHGYFLPWGGSER